MFLAEIGDKTFILTMVSMQEMGPCPTFFGAFTTLSAMHLLASVLGWGVSFVIPAFWTKLICAILFIVVGIAMFIMAAYDRNPSEVDTALGKNGQAFTLSHKEPVQVTPDNQNEGGDSDSSSSSSGSSGSGSEHHSGSGSDSDTDKKSSGSDSSDTSEHHDSSDDEEKADKVTIRKQITASYTPNLSSLNTVKISKGDADGVHDHHRDQYQTLKLAGKKLQRFCCCGMSPYVLFPMMLISGEMCDKTQIVAVSMAPNYGFQSIAIGGIFAQFFSVGLACLCSKVFNDCFNNRFWLDIFAGIMFLVFGLYEIIGEIVMENSNTWAERKV